VVEEVRPEDRAVVIRHDAITNYMPAMTMPFDVKDTNELTGLQRGDVVAFRLQVTAEEGWIDRIQRLGAAADALPKPRESVRRVRWVEPLNLGDPLPDYPLTNEFGLAFRLSEFKGQALGLTFFFTRCPYPNFCPRMSSHFAEAARQLAARPGGPTNWHLLSVSFDPEEDTPAVLKRYGERYRYDSNRWTLATGELVEIDALTEQLGLAFGREGQFFNHNLRTAVIDARGRVQKIIPGNDWKVEDFVAEMIRAAEVRE
jgi:protein SCO1/2